MEAWQHVLDSASMTESDRVLMAFSFGPFVGFWSAFDAAVERGALVMPTGAMSTEARLDLVLSSQATIVFCTPSYALHMAQVAEKKSIDLASSAVRKIIVAPASLAVRLRKFAIALKKNGMHRSSITPARRKLVLGGSQTKAAKGCS